MARVHVSKATIEHPVTSFDLDGIEYRLDRNTYPDRIDIIRLIRDCRSYLIKEKQESSSMETLEDRVEELTGEIKKLVGIIKQLKDDKEGLQDHIDELESDQEKKANEIFQNNGRIIYLKECLSEAGDAKLVVEKLRTDNKFLQGQLKNAEEEMEQIRMNTVNIKRG